MKSIIKNYSKLFKLLSFINPKQKIIFGSLVIFGTLTAILELAGISAVFPLIMSFFDKKHKFNFLENIQTSYSLSETQTLVIFCMIVVSLFMFKSVFQLMYVRHETKVITGWIRSISTKLFKFNISMDYEDYLLKKSPEIISTYTHVVLEYLTVFIFHTIKLLNIFILCFFVIAFLVINFFKISVIVVSCGSVFYIGLNKFLKKKFNEIGESRRINNCQLIEILSQSFKSFRDTKINNKEQYFENRYNNITKRISNLERSKYFYEFSPPIYSEILLATCIVLVFAYFSVSQISPQLLLAQLGTLVLVVVRMIPMLNRVTQSYSAINMTEVAVGKFITLWENDKHTDINLKQRSKTAIDFTRIELKNVSYKYPNADIDALSNINITITKGMSIGILGESGSGKSTLVDIIASLLPAHTGHLQLDDTVIDPSNGAWYRDLISYVSQSSFLLDSSIANNIAFGENPNHIDYGRIDSTLKAVRLNDFVNSLPEGIHSMVGEEGLFLSGGQKQRIAIARALYKQAPILILDEASSALDLETEHELFSTINTLNKDLTLIIVAHRLSTISKCDQLYLISDGKVVESGSPESMKQNGANYQRLLKLNEMMI